MPETDCVPSPNGGGHVPYLVYFSSATNNTHRFVKRLGFPADRIPLRPRDPFLYVKQPYVLVIPTYGGGSIKGAVPKQVVKFLNVPENRQYCRGVITGGNTNFGQAYCIAGDIISTKLNVPHMYKFELLGTGEDVAKVREGLEEFWQRI
ncbi:MAG: class Ib ribonucleoside-diphosphate reductase assembly flavoprotein NrdI [Actinomycetaceae bacterium]|nr:class Ib ribonucleoside-diphosphate reductase assembly flavoprotein NrdI [Actinomycetaceae bacterium]